MESNQLPLQLAIFSAFSQQPVSSVQFSLRTNTINVAVCATSMNVGRSNKLHYGNISKISRSYSLKSGKPQLFASHRPFQLSVIDLEKKSSITLVRNNPCMIFRHMTSLQILSCCTIQVMQNFCKSHGHNHLLFAVLRDCVLAYERFSKLAHQCRLF